MHTHDPFAQILGTRRGRGLNHTLLATHPRTEARSQLRELTAQLRAGDPVSALAAISGRAVLAANAPLLVELQTRLQRWLVTDALRRWYRVSDEFMTMAGLRASSHIVNRFEDGAWCLHFFPEGHARSVNNSLLWDDIDTTLCGEQMTLTMLRAWPRGWQKAEQTRCRICAEGASAFADCQRAIARRPLQSQHEFVRAQLQAHARTALARISSGEHADTPSLRAHMDDAYRPLLLRAATSLAATRPASVYDEISKSRARACSEVEHTLAVRAIAVLNTPEAWVAGYQPLLPADSSDRASASSGGVRSKNLRHDLAQWAREQK
jgi:hypothetical protein